MLYVGCSRWRCGPVVVCVILICGGPPRPAWEDFGDLADDEAQEQLREAVRSGQAALHEIDDARLAIIACYVAMEQSLAKAGAVRAAAETPDELLDRAATAGLVHGAEAARLTDAVLRGALLQRTRCRRSAGTRPGARAGACGAASPAAAAARADRRARRPPGRPGDRGRREAVTRTELVIAALAVAALCATAFAFAGRPPRCSRWPGPGSPAWWCCAS